MKIADSQSIKSGEGELIASIMKKLKPQTLAAMATQDISPENMEFVRGDMVIVDNKIVYKMDFKVTVDLSVMFDREGNLVQQDGDDGEEDSEGDEETLDAEDHDLADLDEQNALEAEDHDLTDLDEQNTLELKHEISEQGDDMDLVFQKNRDFWSQRGDAAKEAVSDI